MGLEPTTFCMASRRLAMRTVDAGYAASAVRSTATDRLFHPTRRPEGGHMSGHIDGEPSRLGQDLGFAAGTFDGPAWIRTRDQRIMSPLL